MGRTPGLGLIFFRGFERLEVSTVPVRERLLGVYAWIPLIKSEYLPIDHWLSLERRISFGGYFLRRRSAWRFSIPITASCG